MTKLNIKKGDTVKIIAGESKGIEGKVIKIYPQKQRALVEGENVKKISKHVRPSNANPQGGIIKDDKPIHVSNLMLIDPASGKPARIGHKRNKDGKLERIFKTKNKEENK